MESGISTGKLFGIQVKAGNFRKNKKGEIVIYVDKQHRAYWLDYSIPVLMIVYDFSTDSLLWEFIDISTVQPTGRGGYKIVVSGSNKLGLSSVEKIRNRLFDKVMTLAIMALQKWLRHGLLPEPAELCYFAESIIPGNISDQLLAFILCATYARSDEIETWWDSRDSFYIKTDKQTLFSMDHLFCHFHGESRHCNENILDRDFGLGLLSSGVFCDPKSRFISCFLMNDLGEGLHIYVINVDVPQIYFLPVIPGGVPGGWRLWEKCIGLLDEEKIDDLQKLMAAT